MISGLHTPPVHLFAGIGAVQAENDRLQQEVHKLQQQDAAGVDSAASAASQEELLAKVSDSCRRTAEVLSNAPLNCDVCTCDVQVSHARCAKLTCGQHVRVCVNVSLVSSG